MKSVAQLAAATLEMGRAASWYEQRVPGLGERFLEAVRTAKLFVRQNPQLGAPGRRGTRTWKVTRFPYLLVYRDEPERVVIVAFAHAKRRPGYWEHRLH
jgi:toxin ParE1/3/4